MSLKLEEERAHNIARDSILKVKVESTASTVNATGRLDKAGGGVDNWSHGAIFGRTKSTTLDHAGTYIARVSLAFTGKKSATAKITFTIEDESGATLDSWSPPPEFKGVDKDMARAKYIIEVL
jgi:hypothetical protein